MTSHSADIPARSEAIEQFILSKLFQCAVPDNLRPVFLVSF